MAVRGRAGGSAALAELIDTHGAAAVDHDLLTLGVNLPDVIDGRESAARALWLIGQLGEGSALGAAAAGGPEHRPWTTANVLAAAAVNALQGGNWQRGGGKGKKPKPIEPPKAKAARTADRPTRRSPVAGRVARRAAARAGQVNPPT